MFCLRNICCYYAEMQQARLKAIEGPNSVKCCYVILCYCHCFMYVFVYFGSCYRNYVDGSYNEAHYDFDAAWIGYVSEGFAVQFLFVMKSFICSSCLFWAWTLLQVSVDSFASSDANPCFCISKCLSHEK